MGRWHASAVARCGHVVSVIIDPDAARASALAAAYSSARTAATLDDGGSVDVVHVCTPLDSHASIARQALSMGAHVLVEKPLAPTLADTAALLEQASAAGRLMIPVHQFLFQRGVLGAQERLAEVGPLLHADLSICTAGATGRDDEARDRLALEVLPHTLALFARLVSAEMEKAGWAVRHSRPGEVRVDGVIAGVAVSALVSTAGRPTTNHLRLIGERGTISADLFHGFQVTTRGRVTRAGKILQPFVSSGLHFASATANMARRLSSGESAYPGLRELVRRFYHAAANGADAPISPAEILAVAAALENIESLLVLA